MQLLYGGANGRYENVKPYVQQPANGCAVIDTLPVSVGPDLGRENTGPQRSSMLMAFQVKIAMLGCVLRIRSRRSHSISMEVSVAFKVDLSAPLMVVEV